MRYLYSAPLPAPQRSQRFRWLYRTLALSLILLSAAVHLRYIASDCPLDLAPDEAHYWLWSRHLDISYYSKGPLVAYLIRCSCELLGTSSPVAVRLPAVACGSLFLLSLYVLTRLCFGSEKLATAVVAFALTFPAIAVSQSLMTIDSPYICCWGWALMFGYLAAIRQRRWAWPLLGLTIGLGILAKYTMVVFIPSLILFLVTSRDYRSLLRQRGFWLAAAIAAACCLPILLWNIQNDWVSLRHVSGQAGVTAAEPKSLIRLFGPLEYLGGQFGLLLGFWFVLWAAAMLANLPGRISDPARCYLWSMSVPTFLIFGMFSLRTGVMVNWPVAAYVSGLVLAAAWLFEKLPATRSRSRRVLLATLVAWAGFGVGITILIHDTSIMHAPLAALGGTPSADNPHPLRRVDPTCRMRGWRTLAKHVDAIQSDLRAQGVEPILAASRWTLASELAFYCEGQPTLYSLGSALWDRQSQFDLWRPNPIRDPARFHGRTFILVNSGRPPPEILDAFDTVDSLPTIRYEEDGQLITTWDIAICRGFRGFSKPPGRRY
jgi:hypothetical protein